jgi:hypothetical protein
VLVRGQVVVIVEGTDALLKFEMVDAVVECDTVEVKFVELKIVDV